MDIESLLGKRQKTIDPKNAIPDYVRLLSSAPDTSSFKETNDQFLAIIENHITTSLGDQNYERAVEELGVMRREMIEYEEPGMYNEIIDHLFVELENGKLNGDRKEMAYLIRRNRLGRIESNESDMPETSD